MITPADVKTRFPVFVDIEDARVQLMIDEAVVILNQEYWAEKYDLGLLYYTAHLLQIDAEQAVSGGGGSTTYPVSGRSVDGVSVSYAVPSTSPGTEAGDAFLGSTQYGQRYLALRETLGIPAYAI